MQIPKSIAQVSNVCTGHEFGQPNILDHVGCCLYLDGGPLRLTVLQNWHKKASNFHTFWKLNFLSSLTVFQGRLQMSGSIRPSCFRSHLASFSISSLTFLDKKDNDFTTSAANSRKKHGSCISQLDGIN